MVILSESCGPSLSQSYQPGRMMSAVRTAGCQPAVRALNAVGGADPRRVARRRNPRSAFLSRPAAGGEYVCIRKVGDGIVARSASFEVGPFVWGCRVAKVRAGENPAEAKPSESPPALAERSRKGGISETRRRAGCRGGASRIDQFPAVGVGCLMGLACPTWNSSNPRRGVRCCGGQTGRGRAESCTRERSSGGPGTLVVCASTTPASTVTDGGSYATGAQSAELRGLRAVSGGADGPAGQRANRTYRGGVGKRGALCV